MPKEQGMQQPTVQSTLPHQIILDERKHLTATGVLRMLHCDETSAAMDTSKGTLTIQGRGLSVRKVSLETGDVIIEGQVDSMAYSERITSRSFWERLMR